MLQHKIVKLEMACTWCPKLNNLRLLCAEADIFIKRNFFPKINNKVFHIVQSFQGHCIYRVFYFSLYIGLNIKQKHNVQNKHFIFTY